MTLNETDLFETLDEGLEYTHEPKTDIESKKSELYACKLCGCEKVRLDARGTTYKCPGCGMYNDSLLINPDEQQWKGNFCFCGSRRGRIVDRRITGQQDNLTTPKYAAIESVIRDQSGFDYYCYNCRTKRRIKLTPKQANQVCDLYEKSLS